MAEIPKVGSKAPAFDLPAYPEGRIRLKDLLGRPVVLYFYPRDNTPGCTKEACAFRDFLSTPAGSDVVVLGVSVNSLASHQKFAEKHSLPFPLLVDEDHALAEKYGVWGAKTLYGRLFQGLTRATFVIDRQGKIAAVWPKVKVKGHVDEVAEVLANLK